MDTILYAEHTLQHAGTSPLAALTHRVCQAGAVVASAHALQGLPSCCY
jgi:hypothetical protein